MIHSRDSITVGLSMRYYTPIRIISFSLIFIFVIVIFCPEVYRIPSLYLLTIVDLKIIWNDPIRLLGAVHKIRHAINEQL